MEKKIPFGASKYAMISLSSYLPSMYLIATLFLYALI